MAVQRGALREFGSRAPAACPPRRRARGTARADVPFSDCRTSFSVGRHGSHDAAATTSRSGCHSRRWPRAIPSDSEARDAGEAASRARPARSVPRPRHADGSTCRSATAGRAAAPGARLPGVLSAVVVILRRPKQVRVEGDRRRCHLHCGSAGRRPAACRQCATAGLEAWHPRSGLLGPVSTTDHVVGHAELGLPTAERCVERNLRARRVIASGARNVLGGACRQMRL